MASFLDVPISVERAVEISDKCSFSTMKEVERLEGLNLFSRMKKTVDSFEGSRSQFSHSHIRKGGSGGWREYFTVGQNDRFDQHHAAKCDIPTYKGLQLDIQWGK